MKAISRRLRYDDEFFVNKIDMNSHFLPDPDNEYPMYIRQGIIAPDVCDSIVEEGLNGEREPAMLGADGHVNKEIRHTEHLQLGENSRQIIMSAINTAQDEIEAFFGLDLKHINGETVALGYPEGGKYIAHADDSDRYFDAHGVTTHWTINRPNRKISSLLYLTDSVDDINGPNQCVGGNLSFPYLLDENDEAFLLEPKKGMIVSFPSNAYFTHQVHEVFDGYRVAVASWFTNK